MRSQKIICTYMHARVHAHMLVYTHARASCTHIPSRAQCARTNARTHTWMAIRRSRCNLYVSRMLKTTRPSIFASAPCRQRDNTEESRRLSPRLCRRKHVTLRIVAGQKQKGQKLSLSLSLSLSLALSLSRSLSETRTENSSCAFRACQISMCISAGSGL